MNHHNIKDSPESLRQELNNISASFSKVKKEDSFRVPADYFSSLQNKALRNIRSQKRPLGFIYHLETRLTAAFNLIFKPLYAVPVTAVLLSIVVAVPLLKNDGIVQDNTAQMLASVEQGTLINYIVENIDEYDIAGIHSTTYNDFIELNEQINGELLNDYIFENIEPQTFEEELL